MKIFFTLILITGIGLPLFAQFEGGTLDSICGNQINAALTDYNVAFQNDVASKPGFEFPKGSGNHLIYSSSAWFGARDESGNLHIAANAFTQGDLFPGALKADGSADAPSPAQNTGIFVVSREEILDHAANYSDPGYVMPEDIANWPANGDVSLDMAVNLAPYFDYNGNGIYDPENGDYPEIRGDHAAYYIMNDKADTHESGGMPLGIEVHVMAYQYETDGFLDSTLFMHYRVINRSTTNYPEFILSKWFDSDIGFSEDDFVGCDSANNVGFGYNADLLDEGGGGMPGYGENPPALGVTTLNYKMNAFVASNSSFGMEPSTPAQYWNVMQGLSAFGEVMDGTRYMYNGNPNTGEGSTELVVGNPAGDRRFVLSSEMMSLPAGGSLCFDLAIFSERVGGTFENAERMITLAPEIQSFYNDEPNTYCSYFVGVSEEEMDTPELLVFPNPSEGNFTVQFEGEFDLDLIRVDGRVIYQEVGVMNAAHIEQNLATGTYYVRIRQDEAAYVQKLVIQ